MSRNFTSLSEILPVTHVRQIPPLLGGIQLIVTKDMARRSIRRLSPFAEHLPEVIEYGQLGASDSIKSGQIKLLNGSWLSGIDEVCATALGRRSE
jgi:hypothetical protein